MKYYYDDPLSAAFMAKHFGMLLQYTSKDGEQGIIGERCLVDCMEWYERNVDAFYIQPNSLKLLEPKRWDVMADKGKNAVGFVMYAFPDKTVIHSSTENAEQILTRVEIYPAGLGNWQIIQRDNKPFHWPKVEK